MRDALSILGATLHDWYEDRAPRLGAALAFYTVFALLPSLILVIALGGMVLGRDAAQAEILDQVRYLAGEAGARAIEATLIAARTESGAGVTAVVVGALIVGLWGVFGELQDALNTIWGVAPRPGRRLATVVRERFLSFAMVVGIGFLLLVSLVISAWLAALGRYFTALLPMPAPVLEAVNAVLSFAVITVLFALSFKLLPDVRVAWRDVWLGAALTSLLFSVGKSAIGVYLGTTAIGSLWGGAGSLVVILVWVYYSSQIFYFGAEFTKVWTRRRGTGGAPAPEAVPVTAEARAEQGMDRERARHGRVA
jgi:membrane protein